MAFRQIKSPALANQAVINTKLDASAVSGQTSAASISSLDTVLIHSAASNALRKITASDLIGSFSTTDLAEGSNLYFTDARAQAAVAADIAAAVLVETNRATAAEEAIADDLAAEVARATAAEGANATAIANEVTRATGVEAALRTDFEAADASLQAQINNIISNVDPDALDSLSEIVAAFQDADDAMTAAIQANATAISTETAARISGDTANATAIANEVTRAQTAEAANAQAVVEEAAARVAADNALDARVTANEGDIATLQSDLATEIATTDSEISTLQSDLAAEITRATGAEQANAANIEAEQNARSAADTQIRTDFAAADAALQSQITSNDGDIATLQSDLSAEVARATAAEGVNATAIANEVTRATAAEGVLTTNLAAEVTRASAAEGVLQDNIDTVAANLAAEITRATGAEDAIAADLAQEILDRAAADANLQSQIDFIVSNTDADALDSLTEIVAAFQAADSSLSGLISANTTAINNEKTLREAADSTLTTNLATEVAARQAADTTLQGNIDAEAATRAAGDVSTLASAKSYTDARETAITTAYEAYADQAEVDAVATAEAYTDARETAITTAYQTYADQAEVDAVAAAKAYTDGRETAITTAYSSADDALELLITANTSDIADNAADIAANAADIAQEVADRQAAITTVTNAITTEATTARAAELANANAIAAEVTRATAAETANATAIANEVTRATGVEAALRTDVDQNATDIATNAANLTTEIAARIAADSALDGRVTTLEGEMDSAEVRLDTAEADIVALEGRMDTAEADIDANAADISTLTGRLDTLVDGADTALDTLKEIGDAFAAADSDLQTLITSNSTRLTTNEGDIDALEATMGSATLTTTAQTVTEAINELNSGSAAAVAALQDEVDTTQAALGLAADGTFVAHSGSNYMDDATTAKGAREALDAALKVEADRAAAAELAESNARVAADNALDGRVTTLEGEMDAAEVRLDTAEADIVTNATAISTEASTRASEDTAIRGEFAAADTQIRADFAAADVTTLNSAKAYADQAELDAVAAAKTYTDAEVGAEETRALAAEALIAGNLATEVTNRTTADTNLQNAIDAEVARATAAEEANANAAAANLLEITATQAAAGLNTDGTFRAYTGTNHIDTATTLRGADILLDAAIKAEETRALAAEGANATAISNEVTRATTAEGVLQDNIDAEASTRATADQGLANSIQAVADNLAQELLDRAAADDLLQTQIDFIKSNTDGAALDSLTEIVAQFQADDGSLEALITANQTAITTEVSNRTSADTALGLRIDAEETARTGADATLQGNIDSEEAARIAADTQLQTNIDGKVAKAGDTMSGNLAMGGNLVTGLGTATAAGDAVSLAVLEAAISAQDISLYTTDNLTEGATNLYFTDARATDAVNGSAYTFPSVAGTEGQALRFDATGNLVVADAASSVLELTDVTDTDYTGKSNYVLAVNADEQSMSLKPIDAITWATPNRQVINGDGAQVEFALDFYTTQTDAMVFVGGVIQDAGTHYTLDGSSGIITFVEALPVGTQAVVISHMVGTVPYLEAGSVSRDKLSSDIKAYTQSLAVSAGTGGAAIDTFDGTAYRSAKYIIQVDGGNGEFETREALVVHDGSNAYITEYALVYTGAGLLGDASVRMNGTDIELVYTANSGTATVKVISTYIDV